VVFAALVALAIPASFARAQNECVAPPAGPDKWPVATPDSVGLSSATLCPVVKRLTDWKEANVHALLIARHGKLVFERYFTGADEHLGHSAGTVTFNAGMRHDERSVSKSVISLVFGIALDRGWIKSIDQPVMPFFPAYANLQTPEKNAIRLRDLLTMSSGFEWHEFMVPYNSKNNSEIAMDFSPDPYKFMLSQPIVAPPGTIWNYNSGSTELLGAILKQVTGKPLDQLARAELFEPLGITDFEWYKYPQNGNPIAAAGLRLRPRDLAKLGQLVLQRGTWNGKQVVSSAYIDSATTPQMNAFDLNFYGYQFWLGRSLVAKREVLWASAVGLGAQRVFVVPEFDLVMVMNAGLYQSPLQGDVPLEILNRYVLNSIQPGTPG
jgi:CubicO group peptidase (beta-lactamase class C family)